MATRNASSDGEDEAPVKATASDAVLAKLSASNAGYYDDEFLSYFASDASGLTASASAQGVSSKFGNLRPAPPTMASPASPSGRRKPPTRSISSPPSLHQYLPPPPGSGMDDLDEYDHKSNDAHFPGTDQFHPALRRHFPKQGQAGLHPGIRRRQQIGDGHQPLIRRGTHARVCCIDRALRAFLSATPKKDDRAGGRDGRAWQVVVLGAGRDTSFLRHRNFSLGRAGGAGSDSSRIPASENGNSCGTSDRRSTEGNGGDSFSTGEKVVRWFEVDHPSVMRTKAELIASCPLIHDLVVAPIVNGEEVEESSSFVVAPTSLCDSLAEHSDHIKLSSTNKHWTCNLVGFNLSLSPDELFRKMVDEHGFSIDAPTLFVLECVQMYIPDTASRALLSKIAVTCPQSIIALYDPILLNDQFGRVMEQHLNKAGIGDGTISLSLNRTLQSQIEKLTMCGFEIAVGCDMMAAYETVITPQQRERANQCEMLDEIEEWVLIMRHYCFVVAATGSAIAEWFCSVGPRSPLGFLEGRCQIGRKSSAS